MKIKEYKTLGVQIKRSVPASYEEFDKLANRLLACLDEGTNNVTYRGDLGEIRDIAIHGREAVPASDGKPAIAPFKGLEELTGKPRLSKKVKKGDKEVEVPGETEEEYIERIFGPIETWKDNPPKQLMDQMQAASDAVPFDPSERVRQPVRPPKLAQKWKDTALRFLSGKSDLAKASALITKTINKTYTPVVATPKDDPKNVEALGWLMKETQDAQDAFANIK